MSRASDLANLIASGSTTIFGEAGVTSSDSTGKTTNLQQGLAKAWINFDGTSTGSVGDYDRGSLNCAVTTDHGTGNFTLSFTNSMGNSNFSVGGMTGGNASDPNTTSCAILCPQQTASTIRIRTGSATSDSDVNREFTFVQVFGDLA